jgi:hypothetical protein
MGLVSRVTPVYTANRNCTRDGGGPFEFGNQVLISNTYRRNKEARDLLGPLYFGGRQGAG